MPKASTTSRVHAGSIGWLLAIFVISAVALFALLYWLTSGYLLHEVDERLRGEVSEFHAIARADAIASIAALSRRDIANSRPYGVFDADHRWLAGNVSRLPQAPDRTPFNYTQTFSDGGRTIEGHYRGIIVPNTSGVRIVVGHSIDEIIEFDRTLVKTLCAGMLLTIVLAISCGFALNRISNRRIRALGEASREIMAGKLDRRLPMRGTNDDLDRLTSIVNTMLDEIERLVQEVRGVCAGIAHDLRTPMTQLRAGLERAGRRARTIEDYALAVDSAIVQSDAVLNRFTALLRIAEIEAAGRQASFAAVSLDRFEDSRPGSGVTSTAASSVVSSAYNSGVEDNSEMKFKAKKKRKMTKKELKEREVRRRLRHIEWLNSPKGTPHPPDTDDEDN